MLPLPEITGSSAHRGYFSHQGVWAGADQYMSGLFGSLTEVFDATLITILLTFNANRRAVPVAVGLSSQRAYWFTASTSYANPAVTIARAFSNTFAGIRPADVVPFILAQLLGAVCGLYVGRWLDAKRSGASRQVAADLLPTRHMTANGA
jgi:hypothetical protein